MARQAAETTAATGERAERVFNASVAKIARELSVKLPDECGPVVLPPCPGRLIAESVACARKLRPHRLRLWRGLLRVELKGHEADGCR
jgi:hypothetical protein